jgi:CheY-like chemotaxis protein
VELEYNGAVVIPQNKIDYLFFTAIYVVISDSLVLNIALDFSRPMRICYVGNASSIHLQRWVKWVASRGHDVHLITDFPIEIDDVKIYSIEHKKRSGVKIFISKMRETKKIVKEIKPDLIILDIMMPGKPVTEILKQIKDIKIVFMSVVKISDARKKGLTNLDNVVDFLQKPFDLTDLIDRIETILGKSSNRSREG